MKKIISLLIIVLFIFSCNQVKKEVAKTEPETEPKTIVKVEVPEPKIVKKESQGPLYGIDISKYQGDEVSKLNKKKDSIGFIICKATEGITYTDPKFAYNWKMIKEKSFLRGAYHFYRSNDDPIKQANNFLTAIATIENTDIPPVIDFEGGGIDKSQSVKEVQDILNKFIIEIESKIKCKPILYTSVSTGNKYLNDPFYTDYPLWIANYNNKKAPNLPYAWKEKGWLIWQKSDHYILEGITDDLDLFNGSLQDFKTFIKKSWKN